METLKLIHKLRNDKMSYFKISDYLNERNILSKENKQWYGNSVRSVYLNNVIYI